MSESRIGLEEYSFNTGQVAVHGCHRNFVCVVDGASQAFDDGFRTLFLAEISQQTLTHWKGRDTAETADRLLDDGDSLIFAESVVF